MMGMVKIVQSRDRRDAPEHQNTKPIFERQEEQHPAFDGDWLWNLTDILPKIRLNHRTAPSSIAKGPS